MKKRCTHHTPTVGGYHKYEDKWAKGHEQRQCPVCLHWYFHGEFGKGWKNGIKYSEPNSLNQNKKND